MHSARTGRASRWRDRSRTSRLTFFAAFAPLREIHFVNMIANLDRQRAAALLDRANQSKIVVLGDVMLDEFLWGDVSRISPEAPVPVVDIRRESTHLGGAANVLANLVALGSKACVVGVVGDDFAGERIRSSVGDKSALQGDGSLV